MENHRQRHQLMVSLPHVHKVPGWTSILLFLSSLTLVAFLGQAQGYSMWKSDYSPHTPLATCSSSPAGELWWQFTPVLGAIGETGVQVHGEDNSPSRRWRPFIQFIFCSLKLLTIHHSLVVCSVLGGGGSSLGPGPGLPQQQKLNLLTILAWQQDRPPSAESGVQALGSLCSRHLSARWRPSSKSSGSQPWLLNTITRKVLKDLMCKLIKSVSLGVGPRYPHHHADDMEEILRNLQKTPRIREFSKISGYKINLQRRISTY